MLVVPPRFNRNSPDVQELGPPADTGLWLIEYMCERLGIANLDGLDVLDLGCGVRFAEAIINRNIPLKSYIGIEVDREIVDFLIDNCTDPRLSFAYLDVRHPIYNAIGTPLGSDTVLPLHGKKFDLVCMFSVITHQVPEDANALFEILRRHVHDAGRLFFSATLEEGDFGYREMFPQNADCEQRLHAGAVDGNIGEQWLANFVHRGSASAWHPIQDSLLCAPG